MHKVWRLYLIDNKSITEISKELNITKNKLKQIAIHEKRFGECTRSRAMKKYCTDLNYRANVDAFNKASKETIKNYLRYV